MLNENSFDLSSKFADLIAASAISNDVPSAALSATTDLREQSAQSIDVILH